MRLTKSRILSYSIYLSIFTHLKILPFPLMINSILIVICVYFIGIKKDSTRLTFLNLFQLTLLATPFLIALILLPFKQEKQLEDYFQILPWMLPQLFYLVFYLNSESIIEVKSFLKSAYFIIFAIALLSIIGGFDP